MTTGWLKLPLTSLGFLIGGGTPPRDRPDYFKGDIPWLTGQKLQDDHVAILKSGSERISQRAIWDTATNLVPAGSVLVSTRVTIGKVAVAGVPLAFSQDVTALCFTDDLKPSLDPEYVAYAISNQRARLLQLNQGSTIVGITRESIGKLAIPIPPLSEQRRIVEILREAETIRRHQAHATRTAAELVPALLSDVSNHRSAKSKLGSFFALPPNYGTMAVATDSNDGVPCIRVGNIRNNAFVAEGLKKVPSDKINDERHRVKTGDLVLVRAIGSLDHLGKCFVVTEEMNGWAFDSHLMRVRLNPSLPAHILHAYFSSPTGRRAFLAKSRKSAVQYNINAGEFAAIEVPAFLQKSRALLDASISVFEAHRTRLALAGEVTNELHASLLAHAFNGSLTARWRDQNAKLLAAEAAARDAALAAKGIKIVTVGAAARPDDEDQSSIYATPTDGAWADLTARQRALWPIIRLQRGAFGITDLVGDYRAKRPPLQGLSEDGFRRELEVYVARGLLVHVSRPQINSENERDVFRHYYRKVPLPENEAWWNSASVKAIAEQLRARLTS